MLWLSQNSADPQFNFADVSIPEGYDFDLPTVGFVGGEDDQSFVNRAAAAVLAELHTRYELVPRSMFSFNTILPLRTGLHVKFDLPYSCVISLIMQP